MKRETSKGHQIQHYILILTAFWTVVASISLLVSLSHIKIHVMTETRNQARAIYDKDVFYRRWNANYGGVYVPVTEKTKPNPYLSHVSNRDITTINGQ